MKLNDLKLVYLSELTVRFCTWSILSGLLLHVTRSHWLTMPKALYIMGMSLSLLYLCAILGGFIKDRILNEKQIIIIGILLVALGNLALAVPNAFYAGLGLFFIGTGMITPNTPLLLSKLLEADNKGDKNFTIFYGITNAGIILGPILGGLVEQYFSWKGVIVLNELIIGIWLVFIFLCRWLSEIKEIKWLSYVKCFSLVSLSSVLILLCLNFQSIAKYILIFATVGYVIFLVWLMRTFKEIKRQITFSFILTIFAIVFFSGEFQVASSLIVYADNFVQLKKINWTIPASSLVSLESIFVVISAFIFTRIIFLSKIRFSQTRILLGLMCCAVAFLILYVSTQVAGGDKISLLWIVCPSLLLGLGEVSLMPSIISYIAKMSPEHYKGRLMSGMYFSLSISGYISGLIGEFIMKQHHLSGNDLSFYSSIFITITLMAGLFSLLLIMLRFSSMHSLGALR